MSHMRANKTAKPRVRKHYANGRRAEYEARDILKAEGWTSVVRAAGSKGAADLVATKDVSWQPGGALTQTLFVSVKRGSGRADANQRERLRALPGLKAIWTRQPRGVWIREDIQ